MGSNINPRGRFEGLYIPEPMSGCFLWLGEPDVAGYGRFTINYFTEHAHRVAYRFYRGPIPDGLHVLHKCDNPACVNPDPLFLGTQADNSRDMWAKGRARNQHSDQEVCVRGHPLAGENVRLWKGHRHCRACMRQRARDRRAIQRAQKGTPQ